MKTLLIFLLMLLSLTGVLAQSGRSKPTTGEKPNQRTTAPTPTPLPTPLAVTSEDTTDQAPDSGDVIKVETDLVTIPVRILDRKGRFVGGLAKENFKVFEDGVEQEIAYFSNEEQPFTVALVLDMSYSTTFKIAEIQSAAISFIDQLSAEDKVMVVSFDQNVHMLCEATSDRQRIYRAIRSTKIQTGTSLYEAVDLVINDRLRRIKGRKAIILFTDGVDTTSTRSNDFQNLDDVRELDALIYPVRYDTFADVQGMKDRPVMVGTPTGTGIPTGPFPPQKPTNNPLPIPIPTAGSPGTRGTTVEEYRHAQEYLDQLALRSGGRLYEANTTGNLAATFTKIASELREYYSLGFYPTDDGKTGRIRRLKVKVDQENLAVRARDSYAVGKPKKRS
jgi:VWFA-related protein